MLKIRQLQKQKQQEAQDEAQAQAHAQATGSQHIKKVSPAQLRVQKDLTELSLPPSIKITFPKVDDLMNFTISIRPEEGFYKKGNFKFSVQVNSNFPIEPPKIKCTQKIYHPNIDLDGNVCLNILREDWSPVLSLNAVIIGLQFLFLEPNPNDPLNKEAANDLAKRLDSFRANVNQSMRGGYVENEKFDNVYV